MGHPGLLLQDYVVGIPIWYIPNTCQWTLQLPFAVCLAGIRAHGWDPLVPMTTGVYDGLQGVPRYFIMGGEYQGHNLLA
jgi:hypothetical protein